MHVFGSGRVYFCIISVSIFDRVYFSCLLLSKIDASVSIFGSVSIYRVYLYFPCLFSKNRRIVSICPCLFFKGIANIVDNGSRNRRGNRRSARVSIFQNHRK